MNFLDMRSFSDESFEGDAKTTVWYVVGGYVGTRKQWRIFEREWRPAVGGTDFHASDIIRGKGDFESWDRRDRDDLQRALIHAIRKAKLRGVVASMDAEAFRQHQPAIRAKLRKQDHKYIEPHVLTFKQYVQLVATKVAPTQRKIAFVCDRRPKGMSGAHVEWYNSEADNEAIAYRRRLGPIAADNRHDAIALHTADMLAYCGYRHVTGNHTPWQWEALNAASFIVPFSYDAEFWTKYLRGAEEFDLAPETLSV